MRLYTTAIVCCAAVWAGSVTQPDLGFRKAPVLKADGLVFRDLNKNGKLDPYEDWRLPVARRVADLIGLMTIEEKAGLMVHASLMGFTGPNGIVLDAPVRTGGRGPMINERPGVTPLDSPNPSELIRRRNVRWILVRPNVMEPPESTARFSNALQEMAEESRLGIPICFSSDPRHSPRAGPISGPRPQTPNISEWPEQIGLGAIGDADVVREFGRIAAQELRALGIQATLSPMADTVTEPRWNRISGTFGEDATLNALLTKAYIEGFQGTRLVATSVMTVTKHFPGDGPVKDGFDPHNEYGKWQVYPGNNLAYHLIPFEAAFEAGTGAIMPGYAIPVGIDTVGMSFSNKIVTGMLRERYHFDGLIVTDWLRNMPWGVESLSEKERQRKMLDAGVDQIGGDNDPKYILELVREGTVPESRLNESARRILTPMFELGLFENPYVDPDHTKSVVAKKVFREAGERAQRESIVLLKNSSNLLPLSAKRTLYVEGFEKSAAEQYGTVVSDPKQASVAIIKVNAPYAVHQGGGGFFRGAHEGTLAYAGAENAHELDAIEKLAASGTPTIVYMYLDRPAVLTEFIDQVAAVLVHFNSDDRALLDIAFGRSELRGKLPFDLPRDMASVLKQKEDVPYDLDKPLFRQGFGLRYAAARASQ
ncbi:MAG TPA: glycoside hydrolase family 3 N-terminal domain-containing protein [Bryobacteraceae bacterium]|nr:glycoside hydrolase family 3 N-terminal domain-containing protein [Bryobacteraceae bacterium]